MGSLPLSCVYPEAAKTAEGSGAHMRCARRRQILRRAAAQDKVRAMPRDLLVGNGSFLVAFDAQYRLADLYYPHVGLENHVGERFRFGVWADDVVQWIEDDRWQRTLTYLRETIVTDVRCQSDSLG